MLLGGVIYCKQQIINIAYFIEDPTRESTSKQTEDFDGGKISKNFPTSYFVIVFLLIGLIVVGFHNRRRILGT